MFVEIGVAIWSGAGLLWWLFSGRLVISATKPVAIPPKPSTRRFLTIFKPLPPLEGRGLAIEARGLKSFIAQLDEGSELLLGVHETDWSAVAPFLDQMQ